MSAKLKALKVAELKDLLASAAVSFPSKATKSDLIAKINASPEALHLFNASHPSSRTKSSPVAAAAPQNDDLLAPPEDVDWNSDTVDATLDARTPVKNASHTSKTPLNTSIPLKSDSHVPAVTPAVHTPAPTTQPYKPSAPQDDEEMAKRKARAARFGVPLVEPPKQETPAKKAQTPQSRNTTSTPKLTSSVVEVPEKLTARALRFGQATPASTTTQKRPTPVEDVDKEELERRKKRRERFGPTSATATKP